MRYRTLGRTGLKVSVIGVGTWQYGGEWGRAYSQAEVDAILDKAAELGINLIDTAECYGDHLSESLIGDYLSRRDRLRWVIATKFGHRYNGFQDRTEAFGAEEVRAQLERSLRALRVDAIDLYQFHSGSDAEYFNEALWKTVAEAKQAGKVRHLGASILGKGSEAQASSALKMGAEALQVIYNRLDQRPEQMYFPYVLRDNLGVLARVPLASGMLSGKYHAGVVFSAGDVRSTQDSAKRDKDLAEIERLRKTEVPPGVDMAQWAIAWCLKNPLVSAAIPGCKDAAQVASNAAADLLPAD